MNYDTMNLFEILFIAGLVLVAVLNVYSWIYNAFSHSSVKSYENLRRDAKIVNVKRDTVGGKNDKKIRTMVIFDDGFVFISHKTDRENHLMSYRIQVTESTAREILADAMKAHQKACDKASK